MFLSKSVLLLTFPFLINTVCAVVDLLKKCGPDDAECHRVLYNELIDSAATVGFPTVGVPPMDPVHLKDITVSILDTFNFTLVNGLGKGIKNCVFLNLTTSITDGLGVLNKICDVYVEGEYKISSSHPIIKEKLEKDSFNGEGNGTLKMDGLTMHIEFHYHIVRHSDGEIYVKNRYKEMTHSYKYTKKSQFIADKIFDNQEENDFAVNFINENIEPVTAAVGQAFVNEVMEFYYSFAQRFYDSVPAKYFMLGDLSSYVKN